MTYGDDEARQAARARLQARMERRGAASGAQQAPVRKRPALRTDAAAQARRETRIFARGRIPVPKWAVIAAAIAIALAVAAVLAAPRCNAPVEAPANDGAAAAGSASEQGTTGEADGAAALGEAQPDGTGEGAASGIAPDTGDAKQRKLVELIGEDEASKLLDAARTNPEALWIAAHPDEFAFDGPEVQAKLLKLAADEPQAVTFAREAPTRYPAATASADASIAMDAGSPSPDVPKTDVPHLYQWDRRWGYTTYSSAAFGLTGCGPTSMAMVCQAIGAERDLGPHDLAKLAEERGYMAQYDGTANTFFTEMAPELGLYCESLYPTSESITQALGDGAVIVANLGPGMFTEHGHFFVLAGLDADGSVIVNDPYSHERSSRTWDAGTIADESLALYAYTPIQ